MRGVVALGIVVLPAHCAVRVRWLPRTRSKIESSEGFFCGACTNEVRQPVTAQGLWTAGVTTWPPTPGVYSNAGRFEANSAIGAAGIARADVVPLPDLRPTVPEP